MFQVLLDILGITWLFFPISVLTKYWINPYRWALSTGQGKTQIAGWSVKVKIADCTWQRWGGDEVGFCWLVVTCRTMSRQDMQRCSALTVSFHCWVAVGNNPMIALLVHARTPSLNKVKPDPYLGPTFFSGCCKHKKCPKKFSKIKLTVLSGRRLDFGQICMQNWSTFVGEICWSQ